MQRGDPPVFQKHLPELPRAVWPYERRIPQRDIIIVPLPVRRTRWKGYVSARPRAGEAAVYVRLARLGSKLSLSRQHHGWSAPAEIGPIQLCFLHCRRRNVGEPAVLQQSGLCHRGDGVWCAEACPYLLPDATTPTPLNVAFDHWTMSNVSPSMHWVKRSCAFSPPHPPNATAQSSAAIGLRKTALPRDLIASRSRGTTPSFPAFPLPA